MSRCVKSLASEVSSAGICWSAKPAATNAKVASITSAVSDTPQRLPAARPCGAVEWYLLAGTQRPAEQGLPGTFSPNLTDHAGWNPHQSMFVGGRSQECPDFPVIAIKRHQGARVEHERRAHHPSRPRA